MSQIKSDFLAHCLLNLGTETIILNSYCNEETHHQLGDDEPELLPGDVAVAPRLKLNFYGTREGNLCSGCKQKP